MSAHALIAGDIGPLALDIAALLTKRGWDISFGFAQEDGEAAVARISTSGLAPKRMRALDFAPDRLAVQVRSLAPFDSFILVPRWSGYASVLAVQPAAWEAALSQNVAEAALVVKAAADILAGQGGGKLVTVLSAASYVAEEGGCVLGVSHQALAVLLKQAALELAPRGVTVNKVLVGGVAGLWQDDVFTGAPVPLTASGNLRDVSEACHYLISDAAAYLTGLELPVDGGLLLGAKG